MTKKERNKLSCFLKLYTDSVRASLLECTMIMANNYYFEKVKESDLKEKADFNRCIEELNNKLEKANEALEEVKKLEKVLFE